MSKRSNWVNTLWMYMVLEHPGWDVTIITYSRKSLVEIIVNGTKSVLWPEMKQSNIYCDFLKLSVFFHLLISDVVLNVVETFVMNLKCAEMANVIFGASSVTFSTSYNCRFIRH